MLLDELKETDRTCKVCRGAICVVGNEVKCESCGLVQKDHPLIKDFKEEVPRTIHVPPLQYNTPPMERVERLEKTVAKLVSVVDQLQSKMKQK